MLQGMRAGVGGTASIEPSDATKRERRQAESILSSVAIVVNMIVVDWKQCKT